MDGNSRSRKRGYWLKHGSKQKMKAADSVYLCPISICKVRPTQLCFREVWTHQPGPWTCQPNMPDVISTRHWRACVWYPCHLGNSHFEQLSSRTLHIIFTLLGTCKKISMMLHIICSPVTWSLCYQLVLWEKPRALSQCYIMKIPSLASALMLQYAKALRLSEKFCLEMNLSKVTYCLPVQCRMSKTDSGIMGGSTVT